MDDVADGLGGGNWGGFLDEVGGEAEEELDGLNDAYHDEAEEKSSPASATHVRAKGATGRTSSSPAGAGSQRRLQSSSSSAKRRPVVTELEPGGDSFDEDFGEDWSADT